MTAHGSESGRAPCMNPTETQRKRLHYRAWHRGVREMDLLLGGFADAWLPRLNTAEMTQFEDLLAIDDATLYDWLRGRTPVPQQARSPMLQRLLTFHSTTTTLP